jgi:hypothetical protein
MLPILPNNIIIDILIHRKNIKYLDRKYEEQQINKINLLEEIAFQVEDMEMCISNMYDNSENYDEEELLEIENTGYSLLLLENINNYNYYQKLIDSCIEEDFE